MKNLKNRKWTLTSRPVGMVGEHNFSFVEEEIRDIEKGEFLIKNLYLSFDPAQRGWMDDRKSYVPPVGIGEVMRAGAVGQIIESNNPDFNVGDKVQGTFGWQEYAISDGKGIMNATTIPDGVSLTAPLSVFGITGLTAYFGLLEVGQVKEGNTVLVSGAAGSTGSIAAQIAKIKGCRVIGVAGGTEKCRWLTEEAKIDAAIDYKAANMAEVIPELCPEGVDVIFDNVGGEFLDTALPNINQNARIAICGAISGYNNERPAPGPSNYTSLIIQRARMEGFIVLDYMDKFPSAIGELMQWVNEGKITYQEDIQEGIETVSYTHLRAHET